MIEKGLASNFAEFEDALQCDRALISECDIFIIRTGKDLKAYEIAVLAAKEYLLNMINDK